MKPPARNKLLCVGSAGTFALGAILIACVTQPGPGPGPGSGPQFIINSPQDGSTVSGAFFLSVQALDPSKVRTVTFTANGETQDVDFDGENKFRVFVVSGDFAEPEIELTATVTGNNGKSSSQTVTVTNEPSPPSDGTVTADGLILGSQEQNGGTSLLIIPPGVGEGANVTFAARTEAEILNETGVDYADLGVTFLGAQEITSDASLDGPLGIASGNFAPMVQPGETIVNYVIAPDADGDGKGELVVVNSASMAPNGDVISDPIPQLQFDTQATVSRAGSSTIRPLQNGISGPPGALVQIQSTGFNAASPQSNVAIFQSLIDDTAAISPGFVKPHPGSSSSQVLTFLIPALPAGPATLILRNESTGSESETFNVTIEAPPALTGTPEEIIDDALVATSNALASMADLIAGEGLDTLESAISMQIGRIGEARGLVQSIASDPTPDEEQMLTNAAVILEGLDYDRFLSQSLGSQVDSQQGISHIRTQDVCNNLDQLGLIAGGVGSIGAALMASGIAVEGLVAGGVVVTLSPVGWVGIGILGVAALGAIGVGIYCYESDPPPDDPTPVPEPPLLPLVPECEPEPMHFDPFSDLDDEGSSRLFPQQAPPPSTFSGMGSGILPGGNGCGIASGPQPPDSFGATGQSMGDASLYNAPGRIVVRAFANGNRLPFNGLVGSSGYFYIPFLSGNDDVELIAIDTESGETRSVTITGPAVGDSAFVLFDFSDAGPPAGTVSWDGGGDGTNWSDPLNWSDDTLPGPDDNVVIDVPGDVTVVHSFAAGTTTINRLTSNENLELSGGTLDIATPSEIDGDLVMNGGTLDGNGDLTVTGTTTWTDATMTGLGTFIVPVGATLEIGGVGTNNLRRNLDNAGTVLWTDGDVNSGDAVIFNNLAGGLFDIQTDGVFNGNAFGAVSLTLNNDGTTRKSAGAGIAEFRGNLLTSDGDTEVNSGTIRNWFSNGTFDGTLTGSANTEYQVGSGTHVFGAGSSISLPHFTTLGGGTITVEGSYDVSDTTEAQAPLTFAAGANVVDLGQTLFINEVFGDVDLSSGGIHSVPTLTIVAGVLDGSDELTVTTGATMTGGSMLGDGTTVIPDGVTLTLDGSAAHSLGRNVDNSGSVILQDGFVHAGRTFSNLPGGLLDLQVDGDWNGNAIQNVPNLTLVNSAGATIRKSGGSGGDNEFSGALFDDEGTVEIQTGTFTSSFTDATLGGTYSGSPGTTLQTDGITQTFVSTSSITVPTFIGDGTTTIEGSYDVSDTTDVDGDLTFAAGANIVDLGQTVLIDTGFGTLDLSSGSPQSVPTLTMTAGTLTGSDELTVTNDATWSGGTQAGSGTTVIDQGAVIAISGTNIKTLRERTFDLEGTATWTDTGQLFGGFGSVLNILATGIFDVQNDATFNGTGAGGGPIATVNVAGTLQKTVATGVSDWTVDCQNGGGTFDFQTGDITFSQGSCP